MCRPWTLIKLNVSNLKSDSIPLKKLGTSSNELETSIFLKWDDTHSEIGITYARGNIWIRPDTSTFELNKVVDKQHEKSKGRKTTTQVKPQSPAKILKE